MVNNQKEVMQSPPEKFDREAIERTLCQIAEVEAARIVSSRGNFIDELHILALPDKGPKQIVRDIESTLMVRFGLAIDHKKISIAQLGGNGNSVNGAFSRLRIGSVNTEISDLHAKVSVELLLGEAGFQGSAEGTASETGRLRLAAEATLKAVELWTQTDSRFSLEDVAIVNLGCKRAAVACISMISAGSESSYSGSAMVKSNENDAIVKATLSAINRRVGI